MKRVGVWAIGFVVAAACETTAQKLDGGVAASDIPVGAHCESLPDHSLVPCAHFEGACVEGVCRHNCTGPAVSMCPGTEHPVRPYPDAFPWCVCIP
jgi:hypothetical protein